MLIVVCWIKSLIGLNTFTISLERKNDFGWPKIMLDETKFQRNFYPTLFVSSSEMFMLDWIKKEFSSNIVSPVTSIEYLLIFSKELNSIDWITFIYSSFTMSNDEKISISPITRNFSQKDVNDGIINKQKQKAAVEGGVTNDLKD